MVFTPSAQARADVLKAEVTLWALSRTAASGRPTTLMAGFSALNALTSTSTSIPSTPNKAEEHTRTIM